MIGGATSQRPSSSVLAVWITALGLALACKSASPRTGRPPQAAPDASITAPARTRESSDERAWRQLAREQRWREAAQAFDRVHSHPTDPLMRFARAKLADYASQHERALDLLNGLDEALEEFSSEISAMRLRAAAHAEADEWLLKTLASPADVQQALWVASASRRQGEAERAARVLDRALNEKQNDDVAREARRLRAELALSLGDSATARQQWYWLALRAPTSRAARDADEQLQRLGAPLTRTERMRRVDAFAKVGDVAAVERELALLAKAPGTSPRRAAQRRALAWAHYHARSYRRASELFDECAKLEAKHRTQDEFYAARALSRAHQDEAAIVRYRRLIQRFPKSSHAEEASFLIARLHYGMGQWTQALRAYDDYLAVHGKRRTSRVQFATYERAVAHLALGHGQAAYTQLSVLLRGASKGRERAMLQQLAGVAALQRKHQKTARRHFERVIAERPLSLSALLAAARLKQMGLEPPPAIVAGAAVPAPEALEPKLPKKVLVLRDLGFHLDAERALAEHARSLRQAYAPRGGEALCEAYGQLDPARQRYRFGVQVVRERAVMQAVTPATRWLWDCLYPQPYLGVVEAVEEQNGLPPGLIHAVMRQESAFATAVRSPAGAVGLMQLIEPTARQVASELERPFALEKLEQPAYNIQLGGHYLGKLLRRFEGNVLLAASSYNAGPRATLRWLESSPQLPLDIFAARILYTETRHYVRRVIGNWARYQYLRGGLQQVPELGLELPAVRGVSEQDY